MQALWAAYLRKLGCDLCWCTASQPPHLHSRRRACSTRHQLPRQTMLPRRAAAAAAGGGREPGAAWLLPAGLQLLGSCCGVRGAPVEGLGGPPQRFADSTWREGALACPPAQVKTIAAEYTASRHSGWAVRQRSACNAEREGLPAACTAPSSLLVVRGDRGCVAAQAGRVQRR